MSSESFAVAIAVSVAAQSLIGISLMGVGARAETPRVTAPVSHENVSVYLLRGTSAGGPVPLTLDEALAQRKIEVVETGNVRELKIENKGSEPVFVQLGDIVKGGRQDRVLTVSLLLAPKSGLVPIGAYCVEQGRWSARDKEDAHRFARSEALLPSAAAKLAIARPVAPAAPPVALGGPRTLPIEAELNAVREREAHARLQRQATGRSDGEPRLGSTGDSQGEVWRSVDVLHRQLSDTLATSVASGRSRTSLQLSLENEALKAAQAAFVAALQPAGLKDDDVIGVAVAIGGRVTSADVYPSNGLFRKMWPKILAAAATEAIALKAKASDPVRGPVPGIESVAAFLSAAEAGQRSERDLGALARLETRESEKVLSIRATASGGHLVHRSYLAK